MISNRLPVHEWLIVILFCLILLVLTGVAFGRQSSRLDHTDFETDQNVEKDEEQYVTIVGAVENPGKFILKGETTRQEIMHRVQLLPNADKSQLKMKAKLRHKQKIVIAEKQWITIQLEGAIETPGPFQVMSGTRCQDLVGLVQLPAEADIKIMQKRRHYLKDGEVVCIPFKQRKE